MSNITHPVNAAPSAYATAFFKAQELIARIEDGLERHSKAAAAAGAHWGHVGDLDSLNATLQDLADRLKNEGEYAPEAN